MLRVEVTRALGSHVTDNQPARQQRAQSYQEASVESMVAIGKLTSHPRGDGYLIRGPRHYVMRLQVSNPYHKWSEQIQTSTHGRHIQTHARETNYTESLIQI